MEAEEIWAGRTSKGDGTQTLLLTEQMATCSNSCPTQDTEPRREVRRQKPQEQELKVTLKLQTFCLSEMREGACALDLDVQPCDTDSRGTSLSPQPSPVTEA